MDGPFFVLPDHVRVEVRSDFCIVIDEKRSVLEVLHPAEALLLSLLDGCTAAAELADMLGTIYRLGPVEADKLVATTLKKTRAFLEASAPSRAVALRYDPRSFMFPGYEELPGRSRPFEAPLCAVLVPTWQCNFRCRYCYFGTGAQPNDVLDPATALRLVEEAAALGVVTLVIGGGEPLLYPHLTDLVAAASRNGMLPTFSTNGSLLTRARLEGLHQAGLRTLQISLDTADPEGHDWLTQSRGSFPKIVQAIREAKAIGLYVKVRSVITPANLDSVPALIDLLASLAVDEVDLGPVKCGSCEMDDTLDPVRIDGQAMEALGRMVAAGRARFPGGRLGFGDSETAWKAHADLAHCGNLTSSLIILPTGRVSACEMIRWADDLSYGDIHEASLAEIWLGPRHRALLAAAMSPAVIDPDCARCESLRHCRTGCLNRSRIASGSFWAKDPRCPGPDAMTLPAPPGN